MLVASAYQRLCLLVHPDKNKEEGAAEALRVVKDAYQIMTK